MTIMIINPAGPVVNNLVTNVANYGTARLQGETYETSYPLKPGCFKPTPAETSAGGGETLETQPEPWTPDFAPGSHRREAPNLTRFQKLSNPAQRLKSLWADFWDRGVFWRADTFVLREGRFRNGSLTRLYRELESAGYSIRVKIRDHKGRKFWVLPPVDHHLKPKAIQALIGKPGLPEDIRARYTKVFATIGYPEVIPTTTTGRGGSVPSGSSQGGGLSPAGRQRCNPLDDKHLAFKTKARRQGRRTRARSTPNTEGQKAPNPPGLLGDLFRELQGQDPKNRAGTLARMMGKAEAETQDRKALDREPQSVGRPFPSKDTGGVREARYTEHRGKSLGPLELGRLTWAAQCRELTAETVARDQENVSGWTRTTKPKQSPGEGWTPCGVCHQMGHLADASGHGEARDCRACKGEGWKSETGAKVLAGRAA